MRNVNPLRPALACLSLLIALVGAAPLVAQPAPVNRVSTEVAPGRTLGSESDREDRRNQRPMPLGDLWTTGVGGRGHAQIDGTLDSGEWSNAGRVDFLINLPGGGITPASLFVMNSRKQLYIALRLRQAAMPSASTVAIELDANGDGVLSDGDDGILLNPSAGVGFVDLVRSTAQPCPPNSLCSFMDVNRGGSNDGSGASGNDGAYTVYELAHPLNSGDPNDVALQRGDRIAFFVVFRLFEGNAIADTNFPWYTLFLSKIQIH